MSQQKINLTFMKSNGDLEDQTVFTKPASNVVRREIQKIEKQLNSDMMSISKMMKEEYPEVFKMQEAKGGDLDKVLEEQDNMSIDDFEAVLDINEELTEKQNQALFKELKIMIDDRKTNEKSGLSAAYWQQLESEPDEEVIVRDTDKETIKYDFWNNQDLDELRKAKQLFFRRLGIGQQTSQ